VSYVRKLDWKGNFCRAHHHIRKMTFQSTVRTLTIRVTPFPARLSARSFVSLLSRYGMWPPFLRESLSDAMQYPETPRNPPYSNTSVQTPSHTYISNLGTIRIKSTVTFSSTLSHSARVPILTYASETWILTIFGENLLLSWKEKFWGPYMAPNNNE
jgi:hypothetical protein